MNFKELWKQVDSWIQEWINKSLEDLKQYAMKESPIKTWEYNRNHKINKAEVDNSKVFGSMYNDTPYAEILEYGVLGRQYNYHRNLSVYYRWVGARVYTRTQDNNMWLIQANLEKVLVSKLEQWNKTK